MADDVLITPASRKIEWYGSDNALDAKIETDATGNLIITNPGGDISIGDTTADVFIGDGINNVDIRFEQDGTITGETGVTLTLGESGSSIKVGTSLTFDGPVTTTNQDLGIYWTAFDKEGTTDFSDVAHIRHTVNSGGLAGSVLEIKSNNDANDGVNFVVNSSTSGVRINGNPVFNDAYHPNADKWTTARTLSLTGAVTGSVSIDGSGNVSLATTATSDPTLTLAGDATGSATFTNLGNATLTVTVVNDSHSHSVVAPKSVQAAEDTTTRNVIDTGIYTFNTNNSSLGDTTPVTYWSTIAWGRGAGGSAELAASWTGGGNELWFRSLRDTTDSWWDWKKIFHDNYHPNADKWTTARTLSLTGDVTGSVSIDGSGNVSLTATVVDDSHNHIISNVDGLQTALDSKLNLSGGTITGQTVLQNTLVVDQNGNNGNIAYEVSGGCYIPRPLGGSFKTSTSTYTGGIAIKLPTASVGVSDMLSFWVDIYDYAGSPQGESVSIYIYGYQYGNPVLWANVGALVLSDRTDRDYNVRFAQDGSRPVVYIGETTSTWSYPQVIVRDFQAGYSASYATYDDAFAITFETTFLNVNQAASNNYPVAKQLEVARNIALTGAVTGSANFDGSGNISIATTHTADPVITLTGAVTGSGTMTNLGSVSIATTHTADPVLTLSGDVTGSATFTNLGNATLTANIAANVVGANELNVSGNGTTSQYLRSDGDGTFTWDTPAASAVNDIFWENGQTVSSNYTITNGKNAMSAGPITINSGVTVTVGDGETWTVV